MDLMEYQAKELFAKHGVPVTVGTVITTPEEAEAAAEAEGGRVVVKAQVKTGGRGKAGGVKLAQDPQDAVAKAREILGMDIKGHTVHRALVAPAADIAEEYYFSFLVDRANRDYLCIASTEGGVEIEVTAHENPDAIARVSIDPQVGVDDAKAAEIVAATGFDASIADQAADAIKKLWTVFIEEDATLVEVNPLVKLGDGSLEALDGKVSLDDNAEFRHEDHARFEVTEDEDPLELAAKEKGLNYVKLDGAVGIIGNGAGLVMSTLDVVAYAGEKHGGVEPANFLDIGGGASAEVMANGLDIILGDAAGEVGVRQRLRRHHGLRRGRQRDRRRPAAARRRGEQAARRTPRRQQRRGGPADPPARRTTRWSRWRTPWTARPTRPPSSREQLKGEDTQMAIFLTESSKVIVQGMTGSEGMKHTQRMLDSGTDVVGGVNPRKAGESATFADGSVPVFGTVAEAMEKTGADVSVVFVPPAFTKAAAIEAIDAGIGLLVVITEGVPVHDTAEFRAYAEAGKVGARRGSSAPTVPA